MRLERDLALPEPSLNSNSATSTTILSSYFSISSIAVFGCANDTQWCFQWTSGENISRRLLRPAAITCHCQQLYHGAHSCMRDGASAGRPASEICFSGGSPFTDGLYLFMRLVRNALTWQAAVWCGLAITLEGERIATSKSVSTINPAWVPELKLFADTSDGSLIVENLHWIVLLMVQAVENLDPGLPTWQLLSFGQRQCPIDYENRYRFKWRAITIRRRESA